MILSARGLQFSYGQNRILTGADLDLVPGLVLGLLGANGAGKSTLLRLLCRRLVPAAGTVCLDGQDLAGLPTAAIARQVAYVPQRTSPGFAFTVEELVAMGRRPHLGWFSPLGSLDRQAIDQAVAACGLEALRRRSCDTLSGGELQLALLARALAQTPRILLLDEATASLDLHHTLTILGLLRQQAASLGLAVAAVIHDLNTAAVVCDQVAFVHQGRLRGPGTVSDQFTPDRLAGVYGLAPQQVRIAADHTVTMVLPAPTGSVQAGPQPPAPVQAGSVQVTHRRLALLLVLALALAGVWAGRHSQPAGQAVTSAVTSRAHLDGPRRVVSTYAAFTDYLEACGAADRLVAATRDEAATRGLPSVGTHMNPDLEAIVAARPDLVLISSRRPDLGERLRTRLAPLGATVLEGHPGTVDESLTLWEDLAGRLDAAERAAVGLTAARIRLRAVDRAVAGVPEDRRPTVFLETRGLPGLMTAGAEAYARNVILRAGGRCVPAVAGGAVVAVDPEAVAAAAPQVWLQQTGAMNRSTTSLVDHPLFGRLPCVSAGRVHQLGEALISRPGPQAAQAVETVHRLLYPSKEAP